MADPFSTAAGVIGIVGFGAQLSQTLFGFANTMISARKELLSIAQEVAQISAVLNQLRKAVRSQNTGRYPPSARQTLLEIATACQERFSEIDEIVNKLQSQQPQNGEPVVEFMAKLNWAARQKSKVKDIRDDLSATKLTLLMMMVNLQLLDKDPSNRNQAMNWDERTIVDEEEDEEKQEKLVFQSLTIGQRMAVDNLHDRENECENEEDTHDVNADGGINAQYPPRSYIRPAERVSMDETRTRPRTTLSKFLSDAATVFTPSRLVNTSASSPGTEARSLSDGREQPERLTNPTSPISYRHIVGIARPLSRRALRDTPRPTNVAVQTPVRPNTQQTINHWETLSSQWQNFNSFQLLRTRPGQPLNYAIQFNGRILQIPEILRLIYDLSAAGQNFSYAIDELQRARSSLEREHECELSEIRADIEWINEVNVQLESALFEEREARERDSRVWGARNTRLQRDLDKAKNDMYDDWVEIDGERERIAVLAGRQIVVVRRTRWAAEA